MITAPEGERRLSKIAQMMHIPLFRDPAKEISDAMGGRPFFWEIGAHTIHRVGLLYGLGWLLPIGGAKDNITVVKVLSEPNKQTFRMEFGMDRKDADPPAYDLIRAVNGVSKEDLRKVYDENTISA